MMVTMSNQPTNLPTIPTDWELTLNHGDGRFVLTRPDCAGVITIEHRDTVTLWSAHGRYGRMAGRTPFGVDAAIGYAVADWELACLPECDNCGGTGYDSPEAAYGSKLPCQDCTD